MSEKNDFKVGRHAGALLPLFSAPGRRSWGIGEIADLLPLCAWLRRAGLDFLQVLPLNEMSAGQHSPYSAVSAMAIDPIFVSIWAVPDFVAIGGESALSAESAGQLAAARAASRIEYNVVRALKMDALRRSFDHFVTQEWRRDTPRAQALRAFLREQEWWVRDYALFRALRERFGQRPWWEWDPPLAGRDEAALAGAARECERDVLFFAYTQWLATTQWHEARHAVAPVGLFGDLPFMVGADSADVWAYQRAFRLDAHVGAPPDAFSETGQDWGLPVYRWDVFEQEGDRWIRDRARRQAELFDGYRIDHLVGFYRTYIIPSDGGARAFVPAEELDQLRQGERLMRVFEEPGACIIAEDLGTVPDFVRDSLLRLGIPGYKVLRWEREWHEPEQPFRDPASYPPASVATTGTHDTETVAEWWTSAPDEEKAVVARLPFFEHRHVSSEWNDSVRDAILELMLACASNLVILPIQDVFGWRDRVNVPATVNDGNWTWRLPWPAEDLVDHPQARERAATLRSWIQKYARSSALFGNRVEDRDEGFEAWAG